MAYTFDGINKLIICQSGTTSIVVPDLYSRWKEWVRQGTNAKFTPAFRVVGGDTIDSAAGTTIPAYTYLTNGWRVRPQEASHTLTVAGGILLNDEGGDPFVNTLSNYRVGIRYSQPVQAIGFSTSGGSTGGTVDLSQLTSLVNAVKAKTDNLPASPASEATLATLKTYVESKLLTVAKFLGYK